jgi:1-acyl-sn-glycerol-3-phosphate acyltransferase
MPIYDTSYSDEQPIENYTKYFKKARAGRPGWGYTFWSLFVWPQALLCRLQAKGLKNIPDQAPIIFAPNHASDFDPFLVMWTLRRARKDLRIHWFTKTQLLRVPFVGWSFYYANVVPVRRGKEDDITFKVAKSILDQGRVVGIFPEGGLSKSGEPAAAKWGVGRLALASGVPVVPVALRNTKRLRSWKALFSPPRITIDFGQPLHFPIASDPNHDQSQKAADEVFAEVKTMFYAGARSGQKLYLPSWLRKR